MSEVFGLLDDFNSEPATGGSADEKKSPATAKRNKKGKSTSQEPRIISIIPAPGIYSMYKGSEEDMGISTVFYPLVCWALVDTGNGNEVVGMDACIEGVVSLCTDFSDFIGYVTEQEIKEMEAEAENNS